MFVKVTSGYLFARLTSAPPGLRLELNFSIDADLLIHIIENLTGAGFTADDRGLT